MATTLHRISITETPQIAGWIDAAAATYPELKGNRAAVLRRIIEVGAAAIERRDEAEARRRRSVIRQSAGVATGSFESGAAQTLKEEWPE